MRVDHACFGRSCACPWLGSVGKRPQVRRRDRIPAGECAVAEDAFLSLCCNPCALCQLLRQEQLIGGAYEFCSTTGGPEQRGGGRPVPV